MSKRPRIEDWKRAYDIAAQIKKMAPWTWMYDLDNFGFVHPETGEEGYVSVMGRSGQHYGITIYRGVDSFLRIIDGVANNDLDETAVLEIDGVSLSFEDRDFVRPEDRKIIKNLELKFRGRNAWPIFRRNTPAHVPWFVDMDGFGFLMAGLERLIAIASLWKSPEKYEEFEAAAASRRYLMCIPSKAGDTVTWTTEMRRIADSAPVEYAVNIDAEKLEDAADLPVAPANFELSMTLMPGAMQDKPKQQPYYCYLLILVDADSGAIAGFKLAPPRPTVKAAYEQLGPFLLETLLNLALIPESIVVRTHNHASLVQCVTEPLGIRATCKPTLPRSEDALAHFANMQ